VVEILEPGPGRREPPCPHFAECGGCDLQHLEDQLQVELKAEAVRETLKRLGDVDLPDELDVRTADPWAYRLRTRVRTADGAVGYFARVSHTLVPIDRCPVLTPELEREVLGLAGPMAPAKVPERLDVAAGDDRVTFAPVVEGLAHGEVSRRIGEFDYAFDARCFFQGHAGLLEQLVACVVGEATGTVAWDLFAGVGLFSLPLARRYESVKAVEGDTVAARYARINGRRNRARNLEVIGGSVDSRVGEIPVGEDRVVVDPPRSGLSVNTREALLERRPRRLTYVSCHAAALARDLRRLQKSYRLEKVTLFDLFPQTGHMEVVAQLEHE
jgi:23S rRNA (uracil1939-C5)-methyltransferase